MNAARLNVSDPRVLHVAAALVALLDAIGPPAAAGTVTHYTTSKRGTLPPGKSRRWLREHARSIPGAQRIGRDWAVSVADFDRWLTTPSQGASVIALRSKAWSAEKALEAAGIRAARDGGRP